MKTRPALATSTLQSAARNSQRRPPGGALAIVLLLALAALAPIAPATAQEDSGDRTLAPFFFVPGGDPALDRLPLKSTSARADIAGVVAEVTVTQVYRNEGNRALEAIYVFPASTRAAVHAMTMRIGRRTIEAIIQERGQARRTYEDARSQGRTASLLEQQRPNVFQMNVANIMPGDEIRVEMSYSEMLVPSDGIYEFVFPTVVGPRYTTAQAATAPDTERWTANPTQHQGEAPTMAFDFTATIAAGMPLDRVACPSHRTRIDFDGPTAATIALDPSERSGANRDVILRWALSGGRGDSGLLVYRGRDENFFLLTVQPPRRITPAVIVPREYIFIVDVSGSMHGFPLDTSKALLRDLIGRLRPSDTFNVVLFAGTSAVLAERSLAATPANLQHAIGFIEREQGGGGTELLPALRRALALPASESASRTVVIATDGYVAVEKQAFELVRASLGRANFFAFGIGSAVNRFLIEGLARAGQGEAFVITGPDKAGREATRFRTMIESPVLTRVGVEFDGCTAYDVEPPFIPDVLAERPIVLVGKLRGEPRGRITVRGLTPSGWWSDSFELSSLRPRRADRALRVLWARQRIAALADFAKLEPGSEATRQVTTLGLTYNLLTETTSFVAVDSEVRNRDGQSSTVTQPLPLPQGVSDLAVGGFAGGIPGGAPVPYPAARRMSVVTESDGGAIGAKSKVSRWNQASASRLDKSEVARRQSEHANAAGVSTDAAGRKDHRATPVRTADMIAAMKTWTFPPTTATTSAILRIERRGASLHLAGIEVRGSLTAAAIRSIVEPRFAALLALWPADGARTVTLTLEIRPDGTIARIDAVPKE